jgi:uroporphyrinogen-III decarboxylase
MKDRWLNLSPDADLKQEERFSAWLSASGYGFESPEAEAAYKKRITLIKDAVQMKKTPQRVPVCPSPQHYPIEYGNISWRDAMYNYQELGRIWKKFCFDFESDAFSAPMLIVPGKALEILDFTLYKWAGHSLRDDQEFQFVEKAYMKPEEYQDLIDDPTGFFLTRFFPRIFGELKALEKTPLLPPVHEILVVPGFIRAFSTKKMKSALSKLMQAGDEAMVWFNAVVGVTLEIISKGYPLFVGGFSKAPFDVIADSLRGTQGIMVDMFRRPDELLEACERLVPFMVKHGIATCTVNGHVAPLIPLHKGADTFMSEKQYQKFYWPSFRKVIIGLVDAGIVPMLFAEGSYNQRLDIISDLPKGKTIWLFDKTDMAAAKKTVGQVSCIAGNVPNDLLCSGTPDAVKAYCRNLIDTAGKGGGFILATGAGMQGAKEENVRAMIDFSKKYGVYS